MLIFFTALHKGLYRQISQMISVCIIHGGIGPHFFSEKLFLQVCGKPTRPATLDEVDDETFKEMLRKVRFFLKLQQAKLGSYAGRVPLLIQCFCIVAAT